MGELTVIEERPALALDLPKDMTFEQWEQHGRRLAATERVLQWHIGDWWAAGQHRYGERARIAAEGVFPLSHGALRNYASVARSFDLSRRRDILDFAHHQEVAALPPADADALLDRAVAEGLTTRALRHEAQLRKVALGILRPRDEVDDDPDHTALVAIARAWNRAPVEVRETFAELVVEAALGEIDP